MPDPVRLRRVIRGQHPGSAWSWHCHWNITPQIQNVADWAISEKNSPNPAWSGRCEQFAEQAEDFQVSYPSALADYQTELNASRIHTGTISPVGTLAFYGGAKERGTLPYPPGTGRRSPPLVT